MSSIKLYPFLLLIYGKIIIATSAYVSDNLILSTSKVYKVGNLPVPENCKLNVLSVSHILIMILLLDVLCRCLDCDYLGTIPQ